jgi:aminoglycoside phosphotransferase (APT) family kinase protein
VTPAWLAALFPDGIAEAEPLGWGFTNISWRVTTVEGRRLAVTRLAHDTGPPPRAGVVQALRDSGLPVARAVVRTPPWPDRIRVSELIDGVTGAALLGDPAGARLVGRLCGSVARRLSAIDPTGLGLPDEWADPKRIGATTRRRAADAGPDLAPAVRGRLAAAVERFPGVLAGRPAVVAHGDLVPVNVLARDGRLVGLLDLETIRVADPLLDAAWFDHIVGFHHPSVRAAARAGYAEGAELGLDDPVARTLLRVLATARILEILDGPVSADRRTGWLDHLRENLERV